MKTITAAVVTIGIVGLAATASAQPPADVWAHLQKLDPGTELAISVKPSYAPRPRYFLAASDSELVTLNLTDPDLPRAVKNLLRSLAESNTTFLLSAQASGGSVSEDDVRLAADGMFVRQTKVGNLADVVERLSREDVQSITRPGGGPLALNRPFEMGLAATGVITYPTVGSDVRLMASVPVSQRHSIELFAGPFAGSESDGFDEDIQMFYGVQVRQVLPGKARPGVEPFMSYGAVGFVSRYKTYHCVRTTCTMNGYETHTYPPVVGLIGGGVHYVLSSRLAMRIEADGLVALVIPLGGRISIGFTVPIGGQYVKRN